MYDRGKESLDVQKTFCVLVCNARLLLFNDKSSRWSYRF